MLKFFRTIRKKLIEQDNVRKYLLYAIGEITLVVIGILIALQVNNWNNDRVQQQRLQIYLQEMAENLESDQKEMNELLLFNQRNDSLITQNMRLFLDNKPADTIAHALATDLYELSQFHLFEPKAIAFDNLTSSGNIDLIKDMALRNNLTGYYQIRYKNRAGTQSRLADVVREFVDVVTPLILNQENIKVIMGEQNQWPENVSLTHTEKSQLLALLHIMRDNFRFQSLQIRDYLAESETLLKQVLNNITE